MDNGLLTANYNPNGNLSKKRFRFYVRPGLFFGATDHDSSEANVAGGSTPYSFLNTRITGARVYYREVSDSDNDAQRDDEGDLYLIADLDFRKGKGIRKSPLSSDWIPFQNFDDKDCFRGHSVGSGAEPAPSYTGANNPDDYYIQAETWVEYATPPKSYRYNTLSAISQQEETVYAKYKHSTIVGNTVFIGNVRVMHRGTGYGSYDDERDHPDCIMASPPGVPDAFPASSLEVGMADGDPIMQLESFADRLLIFKKEKLLIYNVSSDIYIQEAEYRLRGINASGAVCKTDMGVAWINEHGAFMFDGEQIYDLQESNKVRKLSISDWDSFYEDTAIIGYDAIARKLVVVKGTESSRTGDAYMVDILTNAWTFHDSFYTDSKVKGNFINHPDGKLILPYEDSSDVKYEVFTPDTPESGDFEYISKDNDFGEPGVRKKIYRVFVTYKLSSGSVPNISYYVNGDTSSSKAFVAETAFSNSGSQWKTAIYRPNVSIEANNIYSLQLKMDRTGMHSSFEINDITISYRMKTVR